MLVLLQPVGHAITCSACRSHYTRLYHTWECYFVATKNDIFSPAYSEAMGSTGNKNRCSLCPRQLSTIRFHTATQNGVSVVRGDCHAPRRQRGREVNNKDGASCVKYLYREDGSVESKCIPPPPVFLETWSWGGGELSLFVWGGNFTFRGRFPP